MDIHRNTVFPGLSLRILKRAWYQNQQTKNRRSASSQQGKMPSRPQRNWIEPEGRENKCVLSWGAVFLIYTGALLALSHQDFRSKVDPTPIPYKSPSGLIGVTESVPQVLRPPDTLDHTMAFLCVPSRVLYLHDGASHLPYKSPYVAINILLVLFLCKHPNTVCCCTS